MTSITQFYFILNDQHNLIFFLFIVNLQAFKKKFQVFSSDNLKCTPIWRTAPIIFRRGRQFIENLLWEIFNAVSFISGCAESSGSIFNENMEAEICFSHFWLAHNYCGFKNFTTMQNCIIDACFNHCWLMRTFRSYRVARELCKARCGNTSLLFHEKHISWRSSDKFKEFFPRRQRCRSLRG